MSQQGLYSVSHPSFLNSPDSCAIFSSEDHLFHQISDGATSAQSHQTTPLPTLPSSPAVSRSTPISRPYPSGDPCRQPLYFGRIGLFLVRVPAACTTWS